MAKLSLNDRVNVMKPSATLGMAQAAGELAESGIDVMMMSAGEPDFATPKIICNVAKDSIDRGKTHYVPVRGTKKMVSAMQHKFLRDQKVSYGADEVLCTVGAKSALLLALEAMVNEGDEVIICAPFWATYAEQVRMVGAIPIVIMCAQEDNFMPKAKDIASAITKKTKAMLLNSPNNPSGGIISRSQLEQIANVLKETNVWLISDEIYEKLLLDDDDEHISPASINDDMRERTVVISGLSKGYAMTGWRVGVVAAQKSLVGAMIRLQGQQTTCLPEFIQDAAAYALLEDDQVQAEMKRMLDAYKERRDVGMNVFKTIPHIKIFKPKGAFYLWIDFSYYIGKSVAQKIIVDDIDFATRMLTEAHVGCVPGSPFGCAGFLRFSIASSKETILKAAAQIKEWVSK